MRTRGFVAALSVAAALALLFTVVEPLRAGAVQVFGIITCADTSACTGGSNSSSGPGVQGTSAQGTGVVGQTKFNNSTFANRRSGVLGQDLSTSGASNSGVTGVSSRGTGVLGSSQTGIAILGESSSSSGVAGTSVSGYSSSGVGVFGRGVEGVVASDAGGQGDALYAKGNGGNLIRANNSHGSDVFLLADNGTATFTGKVHVNSLGAGSGQPEPGVGGTPRGLVGVGNMIGVQGIVASSATCGPGPDDSCAGLVGVNFGAPAGAVAVGVRANGYGGFLFVGNNSAGRDVFTVDDGGNVHAHSFTADLVASQATSNGSRLTTYAAAARSRTIEDFGEATLVGGQAYVPLARTFAAGIDHSRPYLVFLAPQGPVGGTLYVSQRTSSGFTVRETVAAARSNVAFDYRITARPYVTTIAPPSVAHGIKPMPFVRKALTIPRTHPQSKNLPIHGIYTLRRRQ